MSTVLITSATSQSIIYPTVLTKLGVPLCRTNPHLKFMEVRGSNPRPHDQYSINNITCSIYLCHVSAVVFLHIFLQNPVSIIFAAGSFLRYPQPDFVPQCKGPCFTNLGGIYKLRHMNLMIFLPLPRPCHGWLHF